MRYNILFSTEATDSVSEVRGSTEAVNYADIVVGSGGRILKDRYGNAISVLADMQRRVDTNRRIA